MKQLHRLALAVLLVLMVVGFAGHLLELGDGYHHAATEAACAYHTGFLAPIFQTACVVKAYHLSIFSQGALHAVCLTAKIPHPPTL